MPLADARIPADDIGFTQGWTVFETMRVRDGQIPLLSEHLHRLHRSAEAAGIEPIDVATEIEGLAAKTVGLCRLRVTLSGSGLRVLTVQPLSPERKGSPVRCARGPAVTSPLLPGSVKHGSRAAWVAGVRRAGVDDLLLVRDECFTEATTAGIVAIVDGALWTAPWDGRILPSTTVAEVVEAAEKAGVEVVREGASAHGGWDGLYVASATRGLAPVIELDGEALSGWEPIGRTLAARL